MKYKIYKFSKYFLTDKMYIILTGFIKTKKIPNLKNPKTFYDKIQWLKINRKIEKYQDFADKYIVRKYIKEKIGEKYLIPLIDVYSDVDKIKFDELPEKFVMKGNHGSGYNIICKNKYMTNEKDIKKKLNKWLKENYYYKLREIQYKNIKPLIICEKYIEDSSGGLIDYKFFCSNGKVKFVEVDSDRFINLNRQFYDLNWNRLDWTCRYEKGKNLMDRPSNLEEMINIAKILCEDFPFVRVDLYSVNNNIYFGELTFTPGAGVSLYKPKEVNEFVGELVNIFKY